MQLPTIKDMLAALVSSPSVSSTDPALDQGNMGVVSLLATWLEPLGFQCEIQPLPGSPGKANLLATLGHGPGGLVLAGHADTVPYDDQGWHSDPLQLAERDGRYYGLGTTDMKGFFPLALAAVAPYVNRPLSAPIMILATADEESSMNGARALAALGRPLGRYAVIGEPTGMVPVNRHKSIAMQSITVHGRSGHSSDPALGNSALEAMHEVISALLDYRGKLQSAHHDPSFAVSAPTLNLGCIHGGDNPNRICPSCELHFDARLLPGMSNRQLLSDIRELVATVADRRGVRIELSPLFDGVEAYCQDPGSPLVRAAEALTGHGSSSVAFATEAPFLQQLGVDTLVLGAGNIDCAHQPDEYIELANIAPMIRVLRGLIETFCLTSPPATLGARTQGG